MKNVKIVMTVIMSLVFMTSLISAQMLEDINVLQGNVEEIDFTETTSSLSDLGAIVTNYHTEDIKYLDFLNLRIFEDTSINVVQDFIVYLVPPDKFVDFSIVASSEIFESSLPIELRGTTLHTFDTWNYKMFEFGNDNQNIKLMDQFYVVNGANVRLYELEPGVLVYQIENGIPRGFINTFLYNEVNVNEYFTSFGIEYDEIFTDAFTSEPILEERRIYYAKKGGEYTGWIVDVNNDGSMDFGNLIDVKKSISHEGNVLIFAETNTYDLWVEF